MELPVCTLGALCPVRVEEGSNGSGHIMLGTSLQTPSKLCRKSHPNYITLTFQRRQVTTACDVSCVNQRELISKGDSAVKLWSRIQMQRSSSNFLPSWHCTFLNAYNQGVHRLCPCSTRTSDLGSLKSKSMNPSQRMHRIKVTEERHWAISGCTNSVRYSRQGKVQNMGKAGWVEAVMGLYGEQTSILDGQDAKAEE